MAQITSTQLTNVDSIYFFPQIPTNIDSLVMVFSFEWNTVIVYAILIWFQGA